MIGFGRWYSLSEVFGDALKDAGKGKKRYAEPEDRILDSIFCKKVCKADFPDGDLHMEAGNEDFSLENADETPDGYPLHFPIEKPDVWDMEGVRRDLVSSKMGFSIHKYESLDFVIKTYANNRKGYRVSLRFGNKTFYSERVVGEGGVAGVASFYEWVGEDGRKGCIIVPDEYKKLKCVDVRIDEI